MDVDLWTYTEAARQVDISERTIRRMVSDGDLHRYWWGTGSTRKGPRVSSVEVQAIWSLETMSETWHGKYRFRANRPKRGFIEILDEARDVSGAVVYWDAPIDQLAPHPDGVLVRSGSQVGVMSRNTKGCWTFSLPPSQDLAPAGHGGQHRSDARGSAWTSASAPSDAL